MIAIILKETLPRKSTNSTLPEYTWWLCWPLPDSQMYRVWQMETKGVKA